MEPLYLGVLRWTAVALVAGMALCANAQDDLSYQRRSDRYEGTKPKPVSGFDIELLSAVVDYRDKPQQLSERFHIRFFLPRSEDVHIVVRELDYRNYYWLDRVKPRGAWKVGSDNVFDWPTSEVLRPLGMHISDLGVVARLGRERPSAIEKVAPVVFYQSQFPSRVPGYVFHFRLREDARIKGMIYRASGGDPILSVDLGRQRGGRPFAISWDVSSTPAPEGQYRLVLSGYLLSSNDPVSQVVEFYHRPGIE
jgi:hypothetical protein